jgi:hypothetical protein
MTMIDDDEKVEKLNVISARQDCERKEARCSITIHRVDGHKESE